VPPLASQSIDMIVSHLGDSRIRVATEACVKLESMIKDPETASVCADYHSVMKVLG
jgi:hypothetical protein